MATTEELIESYRKKREKLLSMGGPEAIEKRHKGGQWTVRERIEYFFDPGTFNEIGLFIKHRATAFGMRGEQHPIFSPSDGNCRGDRHMPFHIR